MAIINRGIAHAVPFTCIMQTGTLH